MALSKTPPGKGVQSGLGAATPQAGKPGFGSKPPGGKPPVVAAPATLEDRVFDLLKMKEPADNPLFSTFIEKIAPKMTPPKTSTVILRSFANIDVRAKKITECLVNNPYYQHQFLRLIDALKIHQEQPGLEAAVVLLGMENSRNHLLAMQLTRTIQHTHPEWSKDGKLKVNPEEVLRYALKTETALAGDRRGYADTGYAAGYLYDIMYCLTEEFSEEKKKVHQYMDQVFMHGLKTAIIGSELADGVPEMAFKKFVFSACLLHDIGKVAMAILNPDYIKFVEDSKKRWLPRSVRQFAETKRFGVNHAVLSAICCNRFKMFKPIEKAVLYHHEPFRLKEINKHQFQLSSIICLATNVSNYYRRAEKMTDPILDHWEGPEVKDFKYDRKKLVDCINKLILGSA